jgi:hypothetical protein
MAQATNTTLGTIALSGDLAGSAASPELSASGVKPGTFENVSKIHIDSKGRVQWTGSVNFKADVLPVIANASTTSEGIFEIGRNINQTTIYKKNEDGTDSTDIDFTTISVNTGSATQKGLIKLGNKLEINQSTGTTDCIIDAATTSNYGAIQVGDNLDINAGILSHASWKSATTSAKGMIIPGGFGSQGINVSNGVMSATIASASNRGIAAIDNSVFYLDTNENRLYPHACHYGLWGMVNGISSDFILVDGVLSYTSPYSLIPANASTLGYVKIGSGFYIGGDGDLSIYTEASATQKGLVQVDSNFTVTGGVLSANVASANTFGLVSSGDGTVTGIAIDVNPLNGTFNGNPLPENGTSGMRLRRCDTQNPTNQAYPGGARTANMANVSISGGVIDLGDNIAKKDTFNVYSKAQVVSKQSFVDTDWSRGNVIEINMTSNVTSVPAPVNAVAGQVMTLIVNQDAVGSRTMTGWNSVYIFQNATAPVLSTAANTTDIITIICKSQTEFYVLFSKGYQ